MKELTLCIASSLGGLAVIIGAFGAHALKKSFTAEQLKSFETGVKYQFYHALVLLIMGFSLPLVNSIEQLAVAFFMIGISMFSFSIYLLCLSAAQGRKIKWLGPITPIGGLCLVVGWVLLAIVGVQYGNLL